MYKVSFDFDGVLDREDVQKYARSLVDNGFEVWICTSRLRDKDSPNSMWNEDIYKVANYIGIDKNHIKFCGLADKYKFFIKKDFVFHLDDDLEEINLINKYTNIIGIYLYPLDNWLESCEKIINSFRYKK